MINYIILDRDGIINHNSDDPKSPFYYILHPNQLILKPNVEKAFELLKSLDIKVILATKQRCIGKGLISRVEIDNIHTILEGKLGYKFHSIYVEESLVNKHKIFLQILLDTKALKNEIVLIDDSISEAAVWQGLGCRYNISGPNINLYDAVCELFNIS